MQRRKFIKNTVGLSLAMHPLARPLSFAADRLGLAANRLGFAGGASLDRQNPFLSITTGRLMMNCPITSLRRKNWPCVN